MPKEKATEQEPQHEAQVQPVPQARQVDPAPQEPLVSSDLPLLPEPQAVEAGDPIVSTDLIEGEGKKK